jgi:putative oxidoreductase
MSALLLRLVLGGYFIGHGTQKLFGWFGGEGLDATAKGFEGMGLRPGRLNAIAAGAAEAGGGTLLALGAATPAASAALIGIMLTAVHRVQWKNGPWITKGGYEHNLVVIAAAAALAEMGPGELSIDARLGLGRWGPLGGIVGLLGGGAGALATAALARCRTERGTGDAGTPSSG